MAKEESAWQQVGYGSSALEDAVARLRSALNPSSVNRGAVSLQASASGSGGKGFDRHLAHDLYQQFLAPFSGLLKQKPSLLLTMDGALTSLPASLLVASLPEGENTDLAALRHTDWLVRHHAVTVLPTPRSNLPFSEHM